MTDRQRILVSFQEVDPQDVARTLAIAEGRDKLLYTLAINKAEATLAEIIKGYDWQRSDPIFRRTYGKLGFVTQCEVEPSYSSCPEAQANYRALQNKFTDDDLTLFFEKAEQEQSGGDAMFNLCFMLSNNLLHAAMKKTGYQGQPPVRMQYSKETGLFIRTSFDPRIRIELPA